MYIFNRVQLSRPRVDRGVPLFVYALLCAACSQSDAGMQTAPVGPATTTTSAGVAGTVAPAANSDAGRAAQSAAGTGALATSSTGAAGTPAPGAGASTGSALPCDVANVVKQRCTSCHDTMTKFTAPMPLVTWDDFMAPSKSNPAMPVYQVVLERVKNVTRPMPPQPMAALTAAEVAALESWVTAGTPKRESAALGCAPAPGSVASAVPGAAGSGATETGVTAQDPDVQCYKFLANNGKQGAYDVPATPDLYQCFNFDAPWGTDEVQGVGANFVVDNAAAIHHYILYSSPGGTPNTSAPCPSGAHPDGQFVVGWAPGAPDFKMPSDVGLEVPGPKYMLEAHYNAPKAGLTDASGIELCVTRKKRAQLAATHPLGQEGFATSGPADVTGTCQPKGPFPVHIVWSNPHMHLKGTNMRTIIHRKDGTTEMLIDKPFDFANQLSYDTPVLINEGDTLETTCTYNSPAQFGTGTNQEMCYNFVTAWPAGALSGGPGYTGLSANGNTCIRGILGF